MTSYEGDALPPDIRSAVHDVVHLLVRKQYAELERLSSGIRLTAHELDLAIRRYRRTLTMPPSDTTYVHATFVEGRPLPTWGVVIDLWTEEEGRSDLSLELTAIHKKGHVVIEIDDLRVL